MKNLFPLYDHSLSQNEVFFWPADLAEIRNDPNHPGITWGSKNMKKPRLFSATRAQVLYVVNNRLGEVRQTKTGYYIAVPFSKFVPVATPSTQTNQFIKRVQSTCQGVSYDIFFDAAINGISIIRNNKTKAPSRLKKNFVTAQEAEHYLVTACRGK